ncbi:MAG TPA: IS1595 family transposase, partial [Bryobacteraceae bacterium]|nr:IS1595 family transposase [Bryobacteraceae bacterium]
MANEPKTLQEAILYFADPDNCVAYLVSRRWPNGVTCPTCGRKDVAYIPVRRVWQCKTRHPKAQFSAKVGTIMEDSALGLDKWLAAIWMHTGMKNGVSSWEIHRSLGVSQKCAWHMLHRIRLAMKDERAEKLSGEVEADETFVGGKIAHMHRTSKRYARAKSPGTNWDKTIVLGLLQREGNVRAAVAPSRMKHHVEPYLREHVEPGSKLYTDELPVYGHAAPELKREFVNHLEGYVNGRVHTNGLENFWSLLKRGLKGTYVSVDPAHLQAYVDEQVFRFNQREDVDGKKLTDRERFDMAVSQITGKRLTYAELI